MFHTLHHYLTTMMNISPPTYPDIKGLGDDAIQLHNDNTIMNINNLVMGE